MNDQLMRQAGCWLCRTAPVALAMLFLQAISDAAKGQAAKAPSIVTTTPKQSSTDVDPDLNEISVTFDGDMAKGMSWTSGISCDISTIARGM